MALREQDRLQLGLYAVVAFGLTIGPGLWRLLWHDDARLLAPGLLLRFGTVALTVTTVYGIATVGVRWLTRNRVGGMLGAWLLMFLLILPLVKYNGFRAWIAAAIPPDLADAELMSPAFYVAIVLQLAFVFVGVRFGRRMRGHVSAAGIEAEWPKVPLHPGLSPDYDVLVYDGDCAFCARCVQFILARDDRRTLYFAPRRSQFGAALEARHPELKAVSSVLWVTGDERLGETVHTRWDALAKMGWYLGGVWQQLTRFAGALIPVRVLDAGYSVIAAFRHRLAPCASCAVPTPDDRRRVLA